MSTGSKETRGKILQATLDLVRETGRPDISMSEIARRAGVSRQALYLHFDSRTDLFLAAADYSDQQGGIHELMAPLANEADPVERLRMSARIAAHYEPKIHDLATIFEFARHSDEAAAAAWQDRMEARAQKIEPLVAAVEDAGRLADGWTVSRALDALIALSQPANYRALVLDRGWSLDEYAEWMVRVLDALFIKPPDE